MPSSSFFCSFADNQTFVERMTGFNTELHAALADLTDDAAGCPDLWKTPRWLRSRSPWSATCHPAGRILGPSKTSSPEARECSAGTAAHHCVESTHDQWNGRPSSSGKRTIALGVRRHDELALRIAAADNVAGSCHCPSTRAGAARRHPGSRGGRPGSGGNARFGQARPRCAGSAKLPRLRSGRSSQS